MSKSIDESERVLRDAQGHTCADKARSLQLRSKKALLHCYSPDGPGHLYTPCLHAPHRLTQIQPHHDELSSLYTISPAMSQARRQPVRIRQISVCIKEADEECGHLPFLTLAFVHKVNLVAFLLEFELNVAHDATMMQVSHYSQVECRFRVSEPKGDFRSIHSPLRDSKWADGLAQTTVKAHSGLSEIRHE